MFFFIFICWRLVDIVTSLLATYIIPYLGFFPYKGALDQYLLPSFLTSLANFDGVHFLQIADNGYAQYEQAFFPLYPLVIKAITVITHNRLLSGLFISNVAFFMGFFLFRKYLKTFSTNISWSSLFLLLFPTSFFFGAIYTEGLFFFLFIASL